MFDLETRPAECSQINIGSDLAAASADPIIRRGYGSLEGKFQGGPGHLLVVKVLVMLRSVRTRVMVRRWSTLRESLEIVPLNVGVNARD